mmetsp:Transcript_12204/g.12029  ORF Transcript_12204/g.12029 Transcript_12204/m.12029 type:complete len:113 (-) Transcript_12204:33-371(-)
MLLYSISGAIFLGVGDSMAAIMGKKQGRGYWYPGTRKTVIGSFYLILSVAVAYTGIIMIFCPKMYLETKYLLGSVVVAGLLEGLTQQFDNLVCPILFYSLLLLSHKVLLVFG